MAKRIKSSRVQKWAIASGITGVPLGVLLIWYLFFLNAIIVTGYSGDMVCSGTEENPCLAFINFTANEDIFIYPSDNWTATPFQTDVQVKSLRMYRSWGEGWREIKLNETCKGTWCGGIGYDTKYSFAFRKGRDYQIKYVALKYNPIDNIKWSFGPIDPAWIGVGKYKRKYNNITRTYMIKDKNDTIISEIKLNTDLMQRVTRGYNITVARFTINSFEDIDNFIKLIDFYDINNGMQQVNRELILKYVDYYNVTIQDYRRECSERLNKNGSKELYDCYTIEDGTHVNTYEKLVDYNPELGIKKNEELEIAIVMNEVHPNEKIEWVMTIIEDQKLDYWASWEESYNTDLRHVWLFDKNFTDVLGGFDGTNHSSEINKSFYKLGSGSAISNNDAGDIVIGDIGLANGTYANGTIMMWFKTNDLGVQDMIFATDSFQTTIELTSTNYLSFLLYDGANAHICAGSNTSVSSGWNLLTVTWGAKGMVGYINGSTTCTNVYTSASTGGIVWFFEFPNTASGTDGNIDEAYIWNRALTQAEVTSIWNSGAGMQYETEFEDSTNPTITLKVPVNNTNSTLTSHTFNATFTDNIQLKNTTLYIYNTTGQSINTSYRAIIGTSNSTNISYTFTYDDRFYWNYYVCDSSSNCLFNSTNFTILVDTIYPLITYEAETSANNTNSTDEWIYVNMTYTETNLKNITFGLYNSNTEYNKTTVNTIDYDINWTGLPDETYYYNVTICDTLSQCNSTDTMTRTVYSIVEWWNSTWDFRIPILVNSTAGALTDYQVQFSINTSKLYNEGRINNTCSDLRFTNSSTDEIDFWIEKCNVTGGNSTIWIEVPIIDDTIYMYYGAGDVSSASNETETFLYVEEFEDGTWNSNYWNGTGITNSSDSNCVQGTCMGVSLAGNKYLSARHNNQNLSNITSRFYMKDGGCTSGPFAGSMKQTGRTLFTDLDDDGYWELDSAGVYYGDGVIAVTNEWTLFEISLNTTQIQFEINGTKLYNLIDNEIDWPFGVLGGYSVLSSGPVYFDNWIVAKYVQPEPNYWMGEEEANPVIPTVTLVAPVDNLNTTSLSHTFNATYTDDSQLENTTLWIYNTTGQNINTSYRAITGLTNSTNISYTFTYDDRFYWNYHVCDNSSNCIFNVNNYTLVLDTAYPLIDFEAETSANNTNSTNIWVYTNVSYTESNFKNITFRICNSSIEVNSTTYVTSTYDINWTGLIDGTYYYNVTIIDLVGNTNTTETRQINLDDTKPFVKIEYPLNTTYYTNVSQLNYTLTELNPNRCWYNNGTINSTSVSYGQNFTNVISQEGSNTWLVWCNDTFGNENKSISVIFAKDTVYPLIDYVSPTPTNNTKIYDSFVVNVTYTETNFRNISFSVYNSTASINRTNFTVETYSIKWSGFDDGTYYYNVTITDIANQSNTTETRSLLFVNLYDFNITITNLMNIWFYPNSSSVNGTPAINQTPSAGVFTIHNNLTEALDIYVKMNTTYSYITMRMWNSSNYSESISVNDSYQLVYDEFNVSNTSYLWAWADFSSAEKTWFPELDIKGGLYG